MHTKTLENKRLITPSPILHFPKPGSFVLRRDIAETLFSTVSDKDLKKQKAHFNNIQYEVINPGTYSILSDVEFVVDTLAKSIINQGAIPFTFAKVTNDNKSALFQISKKPPLVKLDYIIEKKQQYIDLIDFKSFSELFIMRLLANPQDGYIKNYGVEFDIVKDSSGQVHIKSLHLSSILGFTNNVNIFGFENLLFFLSQIHKKVSLNIYKKFLASPPEIILLNWLYHLDAINQDYRNFYDKGIFTSSDFEIDSDKDKSMAPTLRLPSYLIHALYLRLSKLQTILRKKQDNLTYFDLLKEFYPYFSDFYNNIDCLNSDNILEVAENFAMHLSKYSLQMKHQLHLPPNFDTPLYYNIQSIPEVGLNINEVILKLIQISPLNSQNSILEYLPKLVSSNKYTYGFPRALPFQNITISSESFSAGIMSSPSLPLEPIISSDENDNTFPALSLPFSEARQFVLPQINLLIEKLSVRGMPRNPLTSIFIYLYKKEIFNLTYIDNFALILTEMLALPIYSSLTDRSYLKYITSVTEDLNMTEDKSKYDRYRFNLMLHFDNARKELPSFIEDLANNTKYTKPSEYMVVKKLTQQIEKKMIEKQMGSYWQIKAKTSGKVWTYRDALKALIKAITLLKDASLMNESKKHYLAEKTLLVIRMLWKKTLFFWQSQFSLSTYDLPTSDFASVTVTEYFDDSIKTIYSYIEHILHIHNSSCQKILTKFQLNDYEVNLYRHLSSRLLDSFLHEQDLKFMIGCDVFFILDLNNKLHDKKLQQLSSIHDGAPIIIKSTNNEYAVWGHVPYKGWQKTPLSSEMNSVLEKYNLIFNLEGDLIKKDDPRLNFKLFYALKDAHSFEGNVGNALNDIVKAVSLIITNTSSKLNESLIHVYKTYDEIDEVNLAARRNRFTTAEAALLGKLLIYELNQKDNLPRTRKKTILAIKTIISTFPTFNAFFDTSVTDFFNLATNKDCFGLLLSKITAEFFEKIRRCNAIALNYKTLIPYLTNIMNLDNDFLINLIPYIGEDEIVKSNRFILKEEVSSIIKKVQDQYQRHFRFLLILQNFLKSSQPLLNEEKNSLVEKHITDLEKTINYFSRLNLKTEILKDINSNLRKIDKYLILPMLTKPSRASLVKISALVNTKKILITQKNKLEKSASFVTEDFGFTENILHECCTLENSITKKSHDQYSSETREILFFFKRNV